jgi:hypothetical protein
MVNAALRLSPVLASFFLLTWPLRCISRASVLLGLPFLPATRIVAVVIALFLPRGKNVT